jgi:peptidoglycan/LPS O-acetylase OafA/YrhL
VVASTAVEWEDTPADEARARRAAEIASLTGLRGLAALLVVLIHTSGLTEFDWLGLPTYGPVSLFVISGYLLYRPWARWSLGQARRPDLGQFVVRRLTRIFPAYWVVLIVVTMVIPAARPDGAGGWWRAVTLTWIYEVEPRRDALLHTWSLATEVSWYAALPILGWTAGWLARRRRGATSLWILASLLCLSLPVSIGWRLYTDNADLSGQLTYPYWLPTFLYCFAAGAAVALLSEAQRAGIVDLRRLGAFCADRWAPVVLAVALVTLVTSPLGGPAGFVAVTFAEDQVRTSGSAAIACLLLCVVVLGPAHVPTNRLLSQRWMVAAGRWSYGIYLWHVPVLVVLEEDITFPDGVAGLLWRLVWVLGIAVPLAAATYAWVERPTMDWSRRPHLPGTRGRRDPVDSQSASATTSAQPAEAAPAVQRSASPDA